MPKMQTSFTGLVSLLAKNLYTSSDAFIRELIQNAHDGCQRLQAIDPERHPRIDISTSIPERSISFADNGIGMDDTPTLSLEHANMVLTKGILCPECVAAADSKDAKRRSRASSRPH